MSHEDDVRALQETMKLAMARQEERKAAQSRSIIVDDLVESNPDLVALRANGWAERELLSDRGRLVGLLRWADVSWSLIGAALGVSAQAAQQRYGRGEEAARSRSGRPAKPRGN